MTPQALIAPARLARRSVLATQSDSRLVDLVRAGYEPAFETIVARYRSALLRYAERFLSRERAEDVVQQSLVSAYEAMLRDTAELNLRPWLYRIAHNTALNGLRDRALGHAELDETIDGVERPDQALERTQGLQEVVAAVQALPERQRDAIVLRELEGRSYDEIATALGVSDGSVRQLLHRARNTLRAGATALTPVGLLLRLPWALPAEPIGARVAELCGAAGAGRGRGGGEGLRHGAGHGRGGGRRGGGAGARRRRAWRRRRGDGERDARRGGKRSGGAGRERR